MHPLTLSTGTTAVTDWSRPCIDRTFTVPNYLATLNAKSKPAGPVTWHECPRPCVFRVRNLHRAGAMVGGCGGVSPGGAALCAETDDLSGEGRGQFMWTGLRPLDRD